MKKLMMRILRTLIWMKTILNRDLMRGETREIRVLLKVTWWEVPRRISLTKWDRKIRSSKDLDRNYLTLLLISQVKINKSIGKRTKGAPTDLVASEIRLSKAIEQVHRKWYKKQSLWRIKFFEAYQPLSKFKRSYEELNLHLRLHHILCQSRSRRL
jgi:hypothetical protein